MKTFMASPATIDRKWYVVDATGMTLGRLAAEYNPGRDTGRCHSPDPSAFCPE